jgi:hypothetical protein
MRSTLDAEIYGKLGAYLARKITLSEFRDWFDSATWDTEEPSSLLGKVELRLAEFSNGHWTEQELRQKLLPLTSALRVVVSFGTASQPTCLSFDSVQKNQVRSVGILPGAASV